MNRNIELIRYRRYGNEFILFELVNAVIASSGGGSTGTPKPSPTYKTVDEYLGAPPDLHALYDDLQTQLVALGDDVQEKHLKYYIAFKRIQNFACVEVHPHARKLLVFVKVDPAAIELTEGFTRDVTDIGHFGTGDLEITIGSRADLDRAMPLIEGAIRQADPHPRLFSAPRDAVQTRTGDNASAPSPSLKALIVE